VNVLDELREREVRKRNVVLYRVGEHENERATGAERADWDRKMCLENARKWIWGWRMMTSGSAGGWMREVNGPGPWSWACT